MLQAEVDKNPDSAGFYSTAFKTLSQAEALDVFWLQNLIYSNSLRADDEILVARLLDRGKTSGRPDDQDEEKIRNRYQEYNEKDSPLMGYYKEQGKFHAVNGGSIDEITLRLSAIIDNL
jgi:adenylate kinase